MLTPQLRAEIDKLWDAFWSGGIANPLTAIEQITYLVFLKRLEDLDNQRAKDAEDSGRTYTSPYFASPKSRQFKWSEIVEMPTSERPAFISGPVFEWLKSLDVTRERMRDAVFLVTNPNLLQRAVTIINKLPVTGRNDDAAGDIYERLLNEIAEAGKNGQFRTPRHIIRAMCDLVDPQFGETICDPACGTGGFLVNAYQHILKQNTSRDILEFEADGTAINLIGDLLVNNTGRPDADDELRRNHLYGFDFDRTMVRLGWMNMIQHGLDQPHLEYADALGSRFNNRLVKNGGDIGNYNVVLANPPFTGSIDKNDIGESLRPLGTNKTELLFLELIFQLLDKDHGRAAVIVPDGVLFGSTGAHKELRRKLVRENRLRAVVSLPGGVFEPYSGVKTSILVFHKGGQTDDIWFYEVGAEGVSLDKKRIERPLQNDLWDMTVKYALRWERPLPVFVHPRDEELLKQLAVDARPAAYVLPLFQYDRRNDQNAESIWPKNMVQAQLLYESLNKAHAEVVTAIQQRFTYVPETATAKALNKLKRELNRLKKTGANEEALRGQRDQLRQTAMEEASKYLSGVENTIRGDFRKAADGVLKREGMPQAGREVMEFAIIEGIADLPNVAERTTEAVSQAVEQALAERFDGAVTVLSLNATNGAADEQAEETAEGAPNLVEIIRPFSRLDGYDKLMFGRSRVIMGEMLGKGVAAKLELPKEWPAAANDTAASDYNLSAGRYSPIELSSVDYEKPTVIIRDLRIREREIHRRLGRLLRVVEAEE